MSYDKNEGGRSRGSYSSNANMPSAVSAAIETQHAKPRKGGRFDKPDPYVAPAHYSTPSLPTPGTPSSQQPRAGSRFDRDLTNLTPFAIPEATSAALASWNADTAKQEKKPLDVPELFPKGNPIRDQRDKVMGDPAVTERTGKPVVKRTYELSWEEYNKLSAEQKAAVDFNTMLVQAREKDLNTDYKETPQQKATYDKAVQNMFGADGGSDTYAPETLAVLRQVDFKPDNGDDLDNYLGLKHAISAKELRNFNLDPQKVSIDAPAPLAAVTGQAKLAEGSVLTAEQQLASGTAAMQEKMAKTHQLLQDFQSSAARARNEDLQFFGGELNKVHTALGFGTDRKNPDLQGIDQFFQNTFNALAMKSNDANLSEIWGVVDQTLKPEEKQAFMRYADERSRQAGTYGLDLGQGKGYRSPEEFRKILGLDRAGG